MDTKRRRYLRPNAASHEVIAAAMKVHSALGAGMFESAIEACLSYEMRASGLHVRRQVRLPIVYRDVRLPTGYRVDYIVEECLLVEIKCVEKVLPIHEAQLHTYLKLTGLKLGLLLNFNVPHLRDGIRRRINGPETDL